MDDPNHSPIVEAALAYARCGWPVFPLHNKTPYEFLMPGVKSHGYKDATTEKLYAHGGHTIQEQLLDLPQEAFPVLLSWTLIRLKVTTVSRIFKNSTLPYRRPGE